MIYKSFNFILISLVTIFGCSYLNVSASVYQEPTSDMTDITSGFTKNLQSFSGGKALDMPFTIFKANYVRNGRITHKTSKVSMTVNGTIKTPDGNSFNQLWIELYNQKTLGLSGSLGGSGAMAESGNTLTINKTCTFTPNSKYLIAGDTIWFGDKVRTRLDSNTTYLYVTKVYQGQTDKITLNPKINGSLDNTATKISGTGTQVGDTITVKEGSNSTTTKVDSNGNWRLDWGKKFTGNSKVSATESNDYGDVPVTVSANVGVKRDVHVQLLKSKASVAPGKSVNLAGVVLSGDTGSDQTDLKNSDFTVHVSLDDGEKIDDFTLNGEKDNSSEEGYFNLDLPANKLKAGANQVSFYVTDKYGNQSKSVTATVNLQGTVQLSSVSKSIGFVSTEVPTEETLVKPSGTWEVNVDDNLVSGQAWSVYATASTMQSGSHTLKGNTVYVDDTGSKHMMTNQSTLVGSGKSTGTQQTTNIAKSWSNKEGIFLDVQPGVYAGQYTGKIDWSLQNTPQS